MSGDDRVPRLRPPRSPAASVLCPPMGRTAGSVAGPDAPGTRLRLVSTLAAKPRHELPRLFGCCLESPLVRFWPVRGSHERVFYNEIMTLARDQRHANQRYYALNRESEIQRVRERQARTLAFLRQLRELPCLDCGDRFAAYQMGFDHRDPSLKVFRLTEGRAMLKASSVLAEELAKCEVVCANCHRMRTEARHAATLGVRTIRGNSRHLERKRATWRNQARLLDDLRDVACSDCRGRFPPCAMDFDHRDPRSKTQGVTRMIGRAGTARILAEVAKCDIVCANCHRARTYRRRSERVIGRE
jgi:hypothetical protein